LCTHPLGLSSGRFPSVLRFRLYQTVSVSDFLGAFQVSALAFPFPAAPTLSEPFGPDFLGAFKVIRSRVSLFGDSDFIRIRGPD
ncbi:hypothetical protein ACFYW9_28190, partial [Streptomyces sp. NPDC002698]|uniref:hypothetical protein n=1 Tax=Streptomyces sp. NPDC002698 TaxID=3364660 RepID=UPI0036B9137D